MKVLFTLLIFVFTTRSFCQISYTGIDADQDPAIEKEKKEKEAYFQNLISDVGLKLLNCEKQCGNWAADANNPKDPCTVPGITPKCICDCRTFYNTSIVKIKQEEANWRTTILKREADFKARKIKEHQQTKYRQEQIGTQQELNLQLKQEQTQVEFANAQALADNAYQEAITNGQKESGAILDATIAGASQISDPTSSLIYTGVGLAATLFVHWREKRQDALERYAALKREEDLKEIEEERKKMIVEAKKKFLLDALKINQYSFNDLLSKERYASLFIVPRTINPNQQEIYFSIPVKVLQYSDSSYPLKDEIEKKLANCIDTTLMEGNKLHVLYPIVDIGKFENDFTGKMGSGHLINLKIALIKFSKIPFFEMYESNNTKTDFWGDPAKKSQSQNSTQYNSSKKQDNFWKN